MRECSSSAPTDAESGRVADAVSRRRTPLPWGMGQARKLLICSGNWTNREQRQMQRFRGRCCCGGEIGRGGDGTVLLGEEGGSGG